MAQLRQCDRCKAVDDEMRRWTRVDYQAGSVNATAFGEPASQDICEKCRHDLLDWVAVGKPK